MTPPGGIWARIRVARAFEELERELDEEFQDHVDRVVQAALDAGCTEAEALARGRGTLGRLTSSRSRIRGEDVRWVRAAWVAGMLSHVGLPIREALRDMRRRPWPHLMRAGLLAVGLAAFGAVWGATAPVRNPSPVSPTELWGLNFRWISPDDVSIARELAWDEIQALRARPGFESLVATAPARREMVLQVGDRVEWVSVRFATADYFEVLGVPPAQGRMPGPADLRAELPHVVLTESLTERLGGSLQMGGAAVLGGRQVVVSGSTPRGFTGGDPRGFDVVFPLETAVSWARHPDFEVGAPWSPALLPRLHVGRTDVLASDLKELGTLIRAAPGERVEATIAPWYEGFGEASVLHFGGSFPVIALGLVLLIVISLNSWVFERATLLRRGVKTAVEKALGASPSQLLAKRMFIGGIVGVVAGAAASLPAVRGGEWVRSTTLQQWVSPEALPGEMSVFLTLITVGLVVSVGVALAAGAPVAGEGIRGFHARGVRAVKEERWLAVGIAGQVGVITAVGIGSAVLGQTALESWDFDPGVRVDDVYVTRYVTPAGAMSPLGEATSLRSSVLSHPAVTEAAWSQTPPLHRYTVGSFTLADTVSIPASFDIVSPTFFDLLDMKLLSGRMPQPGQPEVVVNAALQEQVRTLGTEEVCADIRTRGLVGCYRVAGVVSGWVQDTRMEVRPRVYFVREQPGVAADLLLRVRSRLTPDEFASLNAHVLGAAGTGFHADPLRSLRSVTHSAVYKAATIAGLGAVSLLMAMFATISGLAAVASLVFAKRRGDFALRLALGAAPRNVAGESLARVGVWMGVGAAAGVALVPLVRPTVEHVLLSDVDAATIWSAAGLLVAVIATISAAVTRSAWRAARVSPSELLSRV